MKYYANILILVISITFILPLISLNTFLSQLLHMYLIPFLPGTEPPIPKEFLLLFLQLLIISILIQAIIVYVSSYKFTNIYKQYKNSIYNIFLSLLLCFSITILFYFIILFPSLLIFASILILVTLEHNLNIFFSIITILGVLLAYILILSTLIFLLNFSSQKLLQIQDHFKSLKDKFFLKSNIFFLLIFVIIDYLIFSIIYIFIQLHFYFEVKYTLGGIATSLFVFFIYKEFSKFANKFVTNLNETLK